MDEMPDRQYFRFGLNRLTRRFHIGNLCGMSESIKETIKDLTPSVVARAMNLPVSTVFRWMNEDRIPGKGPAREWRFKEFEAAVARVRAAKPAGNGLTREGGGVDGRAAPFRTGPARHRGRPAG